MATHDEQLASLTAQITTLQTDTAALIAAYNADKTQIATLTAELQTVTAQLAALQASGQIADDTGQLAALTQQAATIATSIEAVLNPAAPAA